MAVGFTLAWIVAAGSPIVGADGDPDPISSDATELIAMTKPAPRGVTPAQLAYVVVFGALVVIYVIKVAKGAATDLDWITLGAAVFLLAVGLFRLLRSFTKPTA